MSFPLPSLPFIIAEAGVNHDGSTEKALRLVDAAARSGADAVKFQTFRADALAVPDAPKAEYQKKRGGEETTQRDMLARLELDRASFDRIAARCAERGILFLSTPFDEQSVDMLVAMGVSMIKLPSGELTNHPLLSHAAKTGKPLILSTGMSTLEEIEDALAAIRRAGGPPVALLHCVSQYPAPLEAVNLRAMAAMRDRFSVPIGYSDHTEGIAVPVAAAALGAAIIEKHFTLDKRDPGPDHAMSLEPDELAAMVAGVRAAAAALGDGVKRPHACELELRGVARRSLVYARDLEKGSALRPEDLAAKRPGTGISPARRDEFVGKTLRRDRKTNAFVDPEDFA